ncbi:hypothetical protein [Burkholderia pseudomallei]|uniref:hypothetical protein n=1 Tax=Burkholderia pseudomallei TaxID=28450 RepID=UPI0019F304A0|nr:hypothetical protein [Burkholderia pseudomallei]MBF3423373.1 hypothetical protein [Burkholderia pseudomallei]MBF3485650.1 hypothetical protein [Burkholderia pseudomallei]MBF3513323.1 hypothetical protein [Burkholderia pseudomallei]MBF3564788.1 hypothetical protein [Burkholderia pseudomallei]MBF3590977.1 hypothetical protein [Burkholderia pseudomallei]
MPSVIHCRARPVRSIVALSSHGMLRYRFAALSLCRFAALPLCRFAALPLCRFAALPLCRFAALPLCRFAAPLRVRGRTLDAGACRARTRVAGCSPVSAQAPPPQSRSAPNPPKNDRAFASRLSM